MSKQAKDNLAEAFTKLGDVAGLVRWGRKNRTEFYKIWARLIPKDVSIGPNEGLEELLLRLSHQEAEPPVLGEYKEVESGAR